MFSDAAQAFFKSLFDYISSHKWTDRLVEALMQGVVSAVIFIIIYAGAVITREGSIVEGLRTAFWDTDLDISRKHKEAEIAVTQAQLRVITSSNKTIDQIMIRTLNDISGSARLRLAEIHNGIAGLTNREMLRADVTHAIARPGRATGDLSVGLPLGSLATYDEVMLGGQCWWNRTDNLPRNPGREHLEKIGVTLFLSCPVRDPARRFLGALSVHWDVGDPVPQGADMKTITDMMMGASNEIGSSLASRQ